MPRNERRMIIRLEGLEQLMNALRGRGYQVIGPTVRDGAIVYDELASVSELPAGWTDEQDAGAYRLKKRGDEAVFGYTVGPHSWKKFLFPPETRLWQADRDGAGFKGVDPMDGPRKLAFIGVRACELHAMAIQDKVFMNGQYVDPLYKSRRENVFVVAVNCGQAGKTCFCASMNTGPKATSDFDLALTEIMKDGGGRFLVETGSGLGEQVLSEVQHR